MTAEQGALPQPDHLLLHRDDLVFPRALPPSVPGRLLPRQGEVEHFEKYFTFVECSDYDPQQFEMCLIILKALMVDGTLFNVCKVCAYVIRAEYSREVGFPEIW